ncbi:uncharacterized protein CDAR_374091 [Caerostris darwini]|uniref:Uncharacterized protein n=1 Tax=Caerostris darwini TaxID=1538125 RepID=A0AAV4P398_9ARAC|nr:uncharacterized protein CDAR_374091 [Caerostris darwini]
MERDKEAETFSEALFTYLWFTENLVCSRTAASTVGDMSDFIAEVAKAVVVLSALTVPSFNESMEEHFKRNDMSRRSVFTFLAKYCFDNHAENEDIFCVILNTCTFVYRLVIFCQHRGHEEYVQFASMCWTEIFEMDLKKDFYAHGGWEQFHKYVTDNCYIPKDKDTDQEAFMNFLKEINYLFPKLNISKPQSEYMVSIATNTELCEHHQMNISEPVNIPSTLNSGQNSEFIENSNQLVVSYNSGEENEESDEHSEMRLHPNSEVSSEESEDTSDSDEELCRELLKECLDVLKKYDDLPPVDWCVVCQNKRDLKAVDDNDNVCVKHNRGSFYYVVAHSETEDLDI